MWELDHKEGRALKNWCFQTVVLEKTLESPLDCKEIQPIHSKGNQFWISIGKTDAEAETPILWWPDAKNWLIGKDPDTGKDWRWEEKGTTEDEMVGWHHQTWWTWVWVNSGSWWWTGKPGVLQSMGSQRVGHDWVLNWTEEVEGRVGGDRTRSFFCFSLNSFSILTTSTFQPSSEYRCLLLWKQFGKLFQLDCSGENAGQIPQEPGLERGKLSGV